MLEEAHKNRRAVGYVIIIVDMRKFAPSFLPSFRLSAPLPIPSTLYWQAAASVGGNNIRQVSSPQQVELMRPAQSPPTIDGNKLCSRMDNVAGLQMNIGIGE